MSILGTSRKNSKAFKSLVNSFASATPVAGLVNCAISERSLSTVTFLDFCYDQAPVVGFRVMANDVVTVRAARYPEELAARLEGAGPRGEIEYLSMKSRRRLALIAGNSPVVLKSFVTVTYPADFPCDGKLVKKHLHALLAALRRRCGALEYLWFLEFQRRGAPHIHVFLSHDLPSRSEMRRKCAGVDKVCLTDWDSQDWLSSLWYGIVGSCDERHLRAGSAWEVVERPEGAARYIAKESYKTFQKIVPKDFRNVGRFWGVSRGMKPDEGKMVHCSEEDMRKIFGDVFDSEGRPFPVLFSAAETYEKIRDTVKDPVKFRAWKSGPSHQKTLLDLKSVDGSAISPRMRRRANDEPHGSILNNSIGRRITSSARFGMKDGSAS